jgi:hypothetical protein
MLRWNLYVPGLDSVTVAVAPGSMSLVSKLWPSSAVAVCAVLSWLDGDVRSSLDRQRARRELEVGDRDHVTVGRGVGGGLAGVGGVRFGARAAAARDRAGHRRECGGRDRGVTKLHSVLRFRWCASLDRKRGRAAGKAAGAHRSSRNAISRHAVKAVARGVLEEPNVRSALPEESG